MILPAPETLTMLTPRTALLLLVAAALPCAALHAADGATPREIKIRAGVDNAMKFDAGTDAAAFAAAAAADAANGYIPAKMKDKVLASIAVLGPKESGEVVFTAPTKPGNYPFLCSFPGHFLTGMKGVVVVKK